LTNWNFFASLMTALLAAIQGGTGGMINGALGYVRPILLAAITVWIAFQAIAVANNVAPLRSLWHGVIRAAVVVFLLQGAANYNQYVSNLATAIPTQVGAALATAGVNTANVANGAEFDTVLNAAIKAGLVIYDQIPDYSFKTPGLCIAIVVYWGIALGAIGISFAVYLASTLLLQLLLAVGPLFVALFAFPQSAKFAAGWVAALVSVIVTQILAVAILIMFMAAETATVQRVTAAGAAGMAGNFMNGIIALGEGALLMVLIAMLVKQAPSLAQGIAGGVYQNVAGIVGAPAALARKAIEKINPGNPPPGSRPSPAPAPRPAQATGRSLSAG
jgi:type IV secretion system protein VirB6